MPVATVSAQAEKENTKDSLHCAPRLAGSLSPRSMPALDPSCHASTLPISSGFSLPPPPPPQWTEFEAKTVFPTYLVMSSFNPWRKPTIKRKIRFIIPKENHLPTTEDRSVLNSHLVHHSLRKPNTCNHRIYIHEGSWDSHQALARYSTVAGLSIRGITTPHLKVFFFFEWQKQNSVLK